MRHGDRGLAVHGRVLILPEGLYAYYDYRFWRSELVEDQFYRSPFSPWGLGVGWAGDEQGICRLGGVQVSLWSHAGAQSKLALQRVSATQLQCSALLPLSPSAVAMVSPYRAQLRSDGPGLTWRKVDDFGKSQDLGATPESFQGDQAWLEQILLRLPHSTLVVGLGNWPDSQLTVDGLPRKTVCWVRPEGRVGL